MLGSDVLEFSPDGAYVNRVLSLEQSESVATITYRKIGEYYVINGLDGKNNNYHILLFWLKHFDFMQ